VDRRGTKWQVAALPFGGYVKFLGDANAASVGTVGTIAAADRRRTMLGAPLWARAATVAAGPIFNFALSIVVFSAIVLGQGRPVDPVTIKSFSALPDGFVHDLQPGDELLSIAGIAVPPPDGFTIDIEGLPVEPVLDYEIRRDGQVMTVAGPYPFAPVVVGVSPGSAAHDAGIAPGDVMLAVNGEPVFAFDEIVEMVVASNGAPMALDVWRDGEELSFSIVPRRADLPQEDGSFETRWLMGISGGLFFEVQTVTPGLMQAIGEGARQMWFIITSSISGLGHMISGAISTCNLSGPVGIAQASGAMASQGGVSFFWFVAVLSTAVGLMNLFPIPVLDGGHLVFHAYEAVTGKPPSNGALRVLMTAGLTLILGLMIFAIMNDVFLCP
jgi:regulator of sigma E protease